MFYTLKHSARARRLRITVRCDASVIVTVPHFFSQIKVEKFLVEKADWIMRKMAYFKKISRNGIVIAKRGGVMEYRRLKHQARALIKEKLAEINKVYNFSFNRVSIKNHKSRWGSCSKKGNLNFNYKIIHLPVELVEYVVAHELCHLKELNHSNRFWALVAKAVPDYKACRRKLKAVFV
jgi:predicted metal-dependent hydrolase